MSCSNQTVQNKFDTQHDQLYATPVFEDVEPVVLETEKASEAYLCVPSGQFDSS